MAKVYKLYLALGIVSSFYAGTDAGVFGERVMFISSFKHWLCQPSEQAGGYNFRSQYFGIGSNEMGDMNFTGAFTTKVNLTSPLKVTVSLKKSFLGVYIPVMCMHGFGSCTYEDLCEQAYTEDGCPAGMEKICNCPLEAGNYDFDVFTPREMLVTKWAHFLSGSYSGIVKLYNQDTELMCYNIEFTLT